MDFSWSFVVAGALVGICVGLTGMGGGALLTPIMVLIFGVDPTSAVGSDLAVSVAMKPVGAAVHQRSGTVRWEIVRWLVPTAIPAGFSGAFVMRLLGDGAVLQDRLKIAIGGALLIAVVGMLARAVLARRREAALAASGVADAPFRVRRVPTLLIGLVGGLIVGMTSVGSGSLIIVMLMLIYPTLRASELVGTDLVQAIPLVAAAAAGHFVAGDTRLGLAAVLLIGAIPGIYVGAKAATRAPGGVLRWVLAILLLGSGLSLWQVPTTVVVIACAALALVAVGNGWLGRRRARARAAASAAARDTASAAARTSA